MPSKTPCKRGLSRLRRKNIGCGDATDEWEQYPEDKTEKELEKHVAPAIRHHMRNFLASIDAPAIRSPTSQGGFAHSTAG